MTLPPLLPVRPVIATLKLPPVLTLPPVAPPQRDVQVQGDASTGLVQVLMTKPDDTRARVAMEACGVRFHGHSLMPVTGVVHLVAQVKGDGFAYRWRH